MEVTSSLTQFDYKRFWRDAVQGFAEWYYDPKYVPLGSTEYIPISHPRVDSTRPPNPTPLTGSVSLMGFQPQRIAVVDVAGFKVTVTPESLSAAVLRLSPEQYHHLHEFRQRKPSRGCACPDLWESRYKQQRQAMEALLQLVLGH